LSDVDVALLLDSNDEARGLDLTAAIVHAVAPARERCRPQRRAAPLSYRVLRDGKVLTSRDDRARVQRWVRTADRPAYLQ
jgi:hypothetical protein